MYQNHLPLVIRPWSCHSILIKPNVHLNRSSLRGEIDGLRSMNQAMKSSIAFMEVDIKLAQEGIEAPGKWNMDSEEL